MSIRVSRAVRAWAVLVAGTGLAGCASSGERLPQCTGKPVPINSREVAGAVQPPRVVKEGVVDAH
jgi:hypothetical protein